MPTVAINAAMLANYVNMHDSCVRRKGVWRAQSELIIQGYGSITVISKILERTQGYPLLEVRYYFGAPKEQRKAFIFPQQQYRLTRTDVTAIRAALKVWCPHIALWTTPSPKMPGRSFGVLHTHQHTVAKVSKKEEY